MKIIFLDIDGVLNSCKYDEVRDIFDGGIDESRLPLVKRIVDATGAKIVLSSTWREEWEADPERCDELGEYINECFEKVGLCIFDKTPELGYEVGRDEEIEAC